MTVADVLAGRASWCVEQGDCLDVLRAMPDGVVQVCACSPPYFGLRSYLPTDHPDKAREVGLEPSLDAYVDRLVLIFREVRRVLHPTGTLWLNVGDSYGGNGQHAGRKDNGRISTQKEWVEYDIPVVNQRRVGDGIKPKDLLMVPATVALALRADGWWLRSSIVWAKTACMPESVTDRPTSAHEHVFLLSKRATYYYDSAAVAEPALNTGGFKVGVGAKDGPSFSMTPKPHGADSSVRNLRNVWLLGPEPLTDDHFAAWPTEIPRRAILAGSRAGDLVLDPFSGSGRTGIVALRLGRRYVGIELSGYQATKSRARITGDNPMFNTTAQPEAQGLACLVDTARSVSATPNGHSRRTPGLFDAADEHNR